jgi:hypothetical protein
MQCRTREEALAYIDAMGERRQRVSAKNTEGQRVIDRALDAACEAAKHDEALLKYTVNRADWEALRRMVDWEERPLWQPFTRVILHGPLVDVELVRGES